jgi:hypothetical protein
MVDASSKYLKIAVINFCFTRFLGFVSYLRNTIIEFTNLLVKFRITSVYCLFDYLPGTAAAYG